MSTSPPSSKACTLPSIHVMFPEHFMQSPPVTYSTQPGNPTLTVSIPEDINKSPMVPHSRKDAVHGRNSVPSQGSNSPRGVEVLVEKGRNQPTHRGNHLMNASGSDATQSPSSQRLEPKGSSFGLFKPNPDKSSLVQIGTSHVFPTRSPPGGGRIRPPSQVDVSNGFGHTFVVDMPAQVSRSNPSGFHHSGRSHPPTSLGETQESPSNRPPQPPSDGPTFLLFPVVQSPSSGDDGNSFSPSDSGNMSDDGDLSSGNSGKKHVCSTCFKRFNRPSSLKIHLNTHTGETPFCCPWQGCGRRFNVNSNMRRHYRNHAAPGFSRSHPSDSRRRRRRAHSVSSSMEDDSCFTPTTGNQRERSYTASTMTHPTISSLCGNDETDDNMSDNGSADDTADTMDGEEDELVSESGDGGDETYTPPRLRRPDYEVDISVLPSRYISDDIVDEHRRKEERFSCNSVGVSSGWEASRPSSVCTLGSCEHETLSDGRDRRPQQTQHTTHPDATTQRGCYINSNGVATSSSSRRRHTAPSDVSSHRYGGGADATAMKMSATPRSRYTPPASSGRLTGSDHRVYSSSTPYLQSVVDMRVSTALRPAFHEDDRMVV